MIDLFRSTTIPALQQTLAFTEKRHELLASNIANMDTPDYRARDLSVSKFQTALAEQIEDAKNPSPGNSSPSLYSPGHSPFAAFSPGNNLPGGYSPRVLGTADSGDAVATTRPLTRDDSLSGPRGTMEPIVYHDGSDVSLERQVTEISKNQSMHNMAVATMRNQFALLRAAISENV